MRKVVIENFQTTEDMKADTRKVFGGEYNISPDFDSATIIDIGACHGAFTAWASGRWDNSKIISYEPDPDHYKLLVENCGEIATCLNMAVAREPGQRKLYKGMHNAGETSLRFKEHYNKEEFNVVETVSPLSLPPCDILKIDCEWGEAEILEDYPHKEGLQAFLCEHHDVESGDKIKGICESLGMVCVSTKIFIQGIATVCYVKKTVMDAFYAKYNTRVLLVSPIYKPDPVTGAGHPQFMGAVSACMRELEEKGIYVQADFIIGDAHIERARAGLLAKFLAEPQWTHLLMIDSDISFHPSVVEEFIKRNVPCVGAAYSFKASSGYLADKPVVRSFGPTLPDTPEGPEGLVAMRYLGGGFILCQRDLIMRLVDTYPELNYDTNPAHQSGYTQKSCALWNPIIIDQPNWGEGAKEMLSEDYSFCERVNRLGETCWLDIYACLGHWDGENCYELTDKSEKEKEAVNG